MALKSTYMNEEDIPQDVIHLYVEVDQEAVKELYDSAADVPGWQLDLDTSEIGVPGATPHSNFKGLHGAIVNATRERDEAVKAAKAAPARLEGVRKNLAEKMEALGLKPDATDAEIQAVVAAYHEKDPTKMIAAAQDAAVAHGEAKMKIGFEAKLAEQDETLAGLVEKTKDVHGKLNDHSLGKAITFEAGLQNVLAAGLPDLLARGRDVFTHDDNGLPVILNADGDVRMGADSQPLTIAAWVGEVRLDAGHLFASTAKPKSNGEIRTGKIGADGVVELA